MAHIKVGEITVNLKAKLTVWFKCYCYCLVKLAGYRLIKPDLAAGLIARASATGCVYKIDRGKWKPLGKHIDVTATMGVNE